MQAKIGELRNRLSYYLKRVAAGETVEVFDRERPVARILPIVASEVSNDPWARRLRESGVASGGSQRGVKQILQEPPPGGKPKGVLDALLREREEGR